jgi:hypothetical protein
MITEENHKGTWCIQKPILCQEGYCSECSLREVICEQCGQRESKCVCETK